MQRSVLGGARARGGRRRLRAAVGAARAAAPGVDLASGWIWRGKGGSDLPSRRYRRGTEPTELAAPDIQAPGYEHLANMGNVGGVSFTCSHTMVVVRMNGVRSA